VISLDVLLDGLTVPSLADTAGMSRSVFVEHFVEAIGHSPMEFLRTIRLDRAARLLTSTDLPVKGIARRVGYISRSSFTRAFVGTHGLGPAAFRAAAQRPVAAADAGAPLPDRRRRRRFDTACMARVTPRVERPTAEHRNTGTRFHPARNARPDRVAHGFSRTPGGAGVLSGRLEPGVRRPDGALQRGPAGVPAPQSDLLADFEPKGAVARSYGAYRAKEGVAERALFVLDDKGTIHWSYLSPGADGILDALESLTAATRAA